MPTFLYHAKKKSGEAISGFIDAANEDEAVELVSQLGLLPVSLSEKTTTDKSPKAIPYGRVSVKEVFYFSRQLSNLMKSGIPILRALNLISDQLQNPYFKSVLNDIGKRIKDGSTFSNGLAAYPKIFNPFYIAMIQAGEESGNLKEILLRLAEHQRSQQETASKIRNALAYPVLMGTVGLGTVFFILTFVMPKITSLFANAGESLPLPTRILMSVSDALKVSWVGVILGIVITIFLIYRWSKTPAGALIFSELKLKLPLYGEFILKAEMLHFCSSMELLLKSGIPIIRALQISVPTLHNEILKRELAACQKDLEGGASFGSSMRRSPLIPAMVANLIVVAEESGSLEDVLRDISDSYAQETNETIKTMTSLLEPLMILIVGAVVGFIVIAMLLPIFQIDIMAR